MELVDPYTLISFVKENDAQYCWKQRCYWCYRWHVPFWMTQTQPPIACRRTRALGMILSCLHCQITWHQRERERSAGTWWNHGEPTNSNLTRTKWKIEWELYWNYRNILSLLHTEFFSPNHGSCRNCSNSDAVRGLNPCEAEKAIVCWARPITSYGGCWGFCLFLPSSFVWQCLVPSDMDVASRAWSCHVPWIEMLCSNMFKPFQTQGTNHSDWSCKLQGRWTGRSSARKSDQWNDMQFRCDPKYGMHVLPIIFYLASFQVFHLTLEISWNDQPIIFLLSNQLTVHLTCPNPACTHEKRWQNHCEPVFPTGPAVMWTHMVICLALCWSPFWSGLEECQPTFS